MRRILASTGGTVAGIALLIALKPTHAAPPARAAAPEPSGSPAPSAGTVNGTFTGDAIETRFGPVQVRITVRNGKLAKVKVLQVPSTRGPEPEIARVAVPQLNKAAVTAGNARIDSISGATYTSEGYRESLQSALDEAGV
ncbi:FMN-binding domain protein [Actinomadura rubteroloni]|uniref:FMN-binding domain protein n=1 Tax=Actinomadura rubteroloni TaxID=1926885 RepID=A0A2P4UMY4_9ACTN|nr:FMN-binding protein [Actinomadura rubteroloni]POM26410.1 FMN-binding domain protein [Actinomadura rubteroloni]